MICYCCRQSGHITKVMSPPQATVNGNVRHDDDDSDTSSGSSSEEDEDDVPLSTSVKFYSFQPFCYLTKHGLVQCAVKCQFSAQTFLPLFLVA